MTRSAQPSAIARDGGKENEAVRAARTARLERYEASTSVWLTVLAFLFLGVYAVPILYPDLPDSVQSALGNANLAIWLVFALDLAVRLVLAPRRAAYALKHPIDVVAVLLPMLRPLRVLRVFTAGQAMFTRGSGVVRTGQAIVFAAAILIVIGALAILDAEGGATDANITTFPDALWWAMTTVTTVGYGDHYPVTGIGQAVASALMVVGISILGVVTATVAAWFVNATQAKADEDATDPAPSTVAQRLAEIEALHAGGAITAQERDRVRERLLDRLVG